MHAHTTLHPIGLKSNFCQLIMAKKICNLVQSNYGLLTNILYYIIIEETGGGGYMTLQNGFRFWGKSKSESRFFTIGGQPSVALWPWWWKACNQIGISPKNGTHFFSLWNCLCWFNEVIFGVIFQAKSGKNYKFFIRELELMKSAKLSVVWPPPPLSAFGTDKYQLPYTISTFPWPPIPLWCGHHIRWLP